MTSSHESLVSEHWRERLNWAALSADQQRAIGDFGLHMYGLGKHLVASIDEIKYDGRLVLMNDGSRWEIDSVDADVVDMWSPVDQVAVIDGVMYNIEDSEHVDVTEED